MKLLFVCLGNICRSPAAEGIMDKMLRERGFQVREAGFDCPPNCWVVDSAGIGGWHVGDLPDPRMRSAALERDIVLNHHCRQIREADFEEFDMIIGMDAQNLSDLRRLAPTPEAEAKVHSIGEWLPKGIDYVPDPYYGGLKGFSHVLDLLTTACENLLKKSGIN